MVDDGKKETIKVIDIEPTWSDIIRIWKHTELKVADKSVYPELEKMAKVCDAVRQAQKKGHAWLNVFDGTTRKAR